MSGSISIALAYASLAATTVLLLALIFRPSISKVLGRATTLELGPLKVRASSGQRAEIRSAVGSELSLSDRSEGVESPDIASEAPWKPPS